MLANAESLTPGVHYVPAEIDRQVASLKLAAMGHRIDELTAAQDEYLHSWEHGS